MPKWLTGQTWNLLAFGHKGSNPLWSNFMTGDCRKAELLKNKYIFVWKSWFFWNEGCRKAADSLRQKKGRFFHRFLVEIFLHKLDSHISHILCVDFFADTATLEYLHRCPIVTLVSKYLRRGVSHIIWRQQQGWNWPESPVCPKIESFLQFWSVNWKVFMQEADVGNMGDARFNGISRICAVPLNSYLWIITVELTHQSPIAKNSCKVQRNNQWPNAIP